METDHDLVARIVSRRFNSIVEPILHRKPDGSFIEDFDHMRRRCTKSRTQYFWSILSPNTGGVPDEIIGLWYIIDTGKFTFEFHNFKGANGHITQCSIEELNMVQVFDYLERAIYERY